jgi:hypothetical protein
MKSIHALSIAAALALTALGSQAAGIRPLGEQGWPPVVESHSTLTRAQVLAEVQDARQTTAWPWPKATSCNCVPMS